MQTSSDLMQLLNKIDHRGYPAYKDLKGAYQFPGYVLSIDHVQGDPFAAPSKVSLHVPGKRASPKIYMIYGTEELPSRMNSQGSFGKGRNALPSRPKAQERAVCLP